MSSLAVFLPRTKQLRRKKKVSIFIALVLIILILCISFDSGKDTGGSFFESSLIENPDTEGIGTAFLKIIGLGRKRKTVPFAKTDVAGYSEFSSFMTKTSENGLSDIEDAKKLQLIDAIYEMYDPEHKLLKRGNEFFEKVFEVLYNAKPLIEKLDKYASDQRIYHARYNTKNEEENVFSEEYLSKFLQLDRELLELMQESHRYVVEHLPDKLPSKLYSGNGIVFVGGGKFNWLTLLSIKSIRAIGCELPIEVLIPNIEEYEPDLCIRVFPALNARCIFLPLLLNYGDEDSIISKFKFEGYQYKVLAILLLSFDNVLLLDSDNIPVHSPESLFNSEPFLSKGLIVWPDFWRRATSPFYYEIANREVSKNELQDIYDETKGTYSPLDANMDNIDISKVPLHLRKGTIPDPTSESGQLMVSKKSHMKALLLALYYNLYGPSHYYPLFSQGSDGEGDKETFLAATVALRKPYYQVGKFLDALGYLDSSNNFQGTGMGQYDPQEDYEVRFKGEDINPKLLFVHSNFPKLNPWELKMKKEIFDSNGERLRLYGTGMKKRCGYDFEAVQWANMKFLLCELKIKLKIYKDTDTEELCQEITNHLEFLKSTVHSLE